MMDKGAYCAEDARNPDGHRWRLPAQARGRACAADSGAGGSRQGSEPQVRGRQNQAVNQGTRRLRICTRRCGTVRRLLRESRQQWTYARELKQSGDALRSSISWSAWLSHGVVSVRTEGSGSRMSHAMSSSVKPTPSRTAHLRGRRHWRCGPSGRPREKSRTLRSTHRRKQVSDPACNALQGLHSRRSAARRWLRADSCGP